MRVSLLMVELHFGEDGGGRSVKTSDLCRLAIVVVDQRSDIVPLGHFRRI